MLGDADAVRITGWAAAAVLAVGVLCGIVYVWAVRTSGSGGQSPRVRSVAGRATVVLLAAAAVLGFGPALITVAGAAPQSSGALRFLLDLGGAG